MQMEAGAVGLEEPVGLAAQAATVGAVGATKAAAAVPLLWSYGDDVAATIALFSLLRSLFYITRERTGRPAPRKAAALLLKYWCSLFVIRLVSELVEDFLNAPELSLFKAYQLCKCCLYLGLAVLSTGLAENFYDRFIATAFDSRRDEIETFKEEGSKLLMQLHEHLIDYLEYAVGALKRKYIMNGGSISLQPRQIVLDAEEAEQMNGRRQGLLPSLPQSVESGVTFFSGGENVMERRSMSMSALNGRGGVSRAPTRTVASSRTTAQKELLRSKKKPTKGGADDDPYEKIRSLRKQMKEGAFKSARD